MRVTRLTFNFRIRAVLPSTNIGKVEEGLTTGKAAHELFNSDRMIDDACASTDFAEPFDIGINAHHDLHVCGTLCNVR